MPRYVSVCWLIYYDRRKPERQASPPPPPPPPRVSPRPCSFAPLEISPLRVNEEFFTSVRFTLPRDNRVSIIRNDVICRTSLRVL